ncbi:hypothetical protein D9M71_649630 [compost metagenome]
MRGMMRCPLPSLFSQRMGRSGSKYLSSWLAKCARMKAIRLVFPLSGRPAKATEAPPRRPLMCASSTGSGNFKPKSFSSCLRMSSMLS